MRVETNQDVVQLLCETAVKTVSGNTPVETIQNGDHDSDTGSSESQSQIQNHQNSLLNETDQPESQIHNSLLFDSIIDQTTEMRLIRIEQSLLKLQIQIDKLVTDNGKLQSELCALKAQLLIKDKETEKLKLENADLKITARNQKRQLSREIDELDSLAKTILTLDNKNASQRN